MEIENCSSLPAEEIIDLFDYLLPVARVKFIIVLIQVIDSGTGKRVIGNQAPIDINAAAGIESRFHHDLLRLFPANQFAKTAPALGWGPFFTSFRVPLLADK